jgi:FlaA1/EpsC-like NDP-sugar epimerase
MATRGDHAAPEDRPRRLEETGLLRQQHQFFVALLCLVDGLVVAAACMAAWSLRMQVVEGYFPTGNWESWVKGPLFIFAIPVVLTTMWFFGLYRPRRDRNLWPEQRAIIKTCLVSMAALIVVLWAVENDAVVRPERAVRTLEAANVRLRGGRFQLILLAGILPLFLSIHRAAFRAALRQVRRRGRNLRHVAVVGVGRLGQIVYRTLGRNSWTGINVAYFISHHAQTNRKMCMDRPVHGGLEDLERILETHRVDAVYLAVPIAQAAAVPKALQTLE